MRPSHKQKKTENILEQFIFGLFQPPAQPILIVAPTGTGKSGMITLLPYVLASKRVLILTPSLIISEQMAIAFGADKAKHCFFETCGLVQDSHSDWKQVLECLLEEVWMVKGKTDITRNLGRLVIVNAQKFGRRSKLSLVYNNKDIIKNVEEFFHQFDTQLVDEAHHYPAATWYKIIEEFGKPAVGMKKKIVFLTATPYKNIKGKMEFILGPEESKQKRIAFVVKPEDTKGVSVRRCKFVEKEHGPHGKKEEQGFKKVYKDVQKLLKKNSKREPRFLPRAMILVRLRKDAEELVEVLNHMSGKRNYAVAFLGDRPAAAALEQFTQGRFRVGVTCGIAREGLANPRVSVVGILGRIVSGTILFDQFVGRCMRIQRGLKGRGVGRSRGMVLSYKEFGQRKLWEAREKCVAEDDPVEDHCDD